MTSLKWNVGDKLHKLPRNKRRKKSKPAEILELYKTQDKGIYLSMVKIRLASGREVYCSYRVLDSYYLW